MDVMKEQLKKLEKDRRDQQEAFNGSLHGPVAS